MHQMFIFKCVANTIWIMHEFYTIFPTEIEILNRNIIWFKWTKMALYDFLILWQNTMKESRVHEIYIWSLQWKYSEIKRINEQLKSKIQKYMLRKGDLHTKFEQKK